MNQRIYILDTSFLIELYALPRKSKAHRVLDARKWFGEARAARHGLQVPFACVLEFGNKIAQLDDASARAQYAAILARDFEAAVTSGHQAPWVATDAPQFESAVALLSQWSQRDAPHGRSLVDAAIVRAAEVRKSRDRAVPVHIWTYDQKLKSVEPDPEPSPFPMT